MHIKLKHNESASEKRLAGTIVDWGVYIVEEAVNMALFAGALFLFWILIRPLLCALFYEIATKHFGSPITNSFVVWLQQNALLFTWQIV